MMKNISLIAMLSFMAYQRIAAAPQYWSSVDSPSQLHNYNEMQLNQLDPHLISTLQHLLQRLAENHPAPNWAGHLQTLTPTAKTGCSKEENQIKERHYNNGLYEVGNHLKPKDFGEHKTPAQAGQEAYYFNSMEGKQNSPATQTDRADPEFYLNQGYKYMTASQENRRHHQPNYHSGTTNTISVQPELHCNENSGFGKHAPKLPGIQINQYGTNKFEQHWYDGLKNSNHPHLRKSLHEQTHTNKFETPNKNDESFLNTYSGSAGHGPFVGVAQAQKPSLKYPKASSESPKESAYKNFNSSISAGKHNRVPNNRNPILSTANDESSASIATSTAFTAPEIKIEDATSATTAAPAQTTPAPDTHGVHLNSSSSAGEHSGVPNKSNPILSTPYIENSTSMTTTLTAYTAPKIKIEDTSSATTAAPAQPTQAPNTHGVDLSNSSRVGEHNEFPNRNPIITTPYVESSTSISTRPTAFTAPKFKIDDVISATTAAPAQTKPAPDTHGVDDTLKEDVLSMAVVTESVTTSTDIPAQNEEKVANHQFVDGFHSYEYEPAFYVDSFSPISTELRRNSPTTTLNWSSMQTPLRDTYIRSQPRFAELQPSFTQENIKNADSFAGWEYWEDGHNSDMSEGIGHVGTDSHDSHEFFNFLRYC